MSLSIISRAKKLLRRFACTPAPTNRFRPVLEGFEDRVVPSAPPPGCVVTVEKIADATEGGATGLFRFSRTGDVTQAIAVNYTAGGTATNTADYTGLPAQIEFAAAQATVNVIITAINDGIKEPDETATVTLVVGFGYNLGTPSSADMTIFNRPWLVNTTGDGPDVNLNDGNPADANGNISLRAAIMQANQNALVTPGTRDIGFAPGLNQAPGGGQIPATITLTNGVLPTISASLEITGPGKDLLEIIGTGNTGMLTTNAVATLTLKFLTYANGVNTTGQGGAGQGGALHNQGAMTLVGVRVRNCTANEGGAIYNLGSLTMDNCEIQQNHAIHLVNGYGGGISLPGNATLTITSSALVGNWARVRGGGVGIRFTGQLTMTDTVVSGNSAQIGGGVYNSAGTLVMTRGALSGNGADLDGGGLVAGGNSTLQDVQILNNTAGRVGGGIFHEANTLTITGSLSLLDNNEAKNGAGVYQKGGTANLQDVTISNNQATEWGGAFYAEGGATVTFTAATFAGNQATLGGAKIAKKGNPMITVDPTCVGINPVVDIEADPR